MYARLNPRMGSKHTASSRSRNGVHGSARVSLTSCSAVIQCSSPWSQARLTLSRLEEPVKEEPRWFSRAVDFSGKSYTRSRTCAHFPRR